MTKLCKSIYIYMLRVVIMMSILCQCQSKCNYHITYLNIRLWQGCQLIIAGPLPYLPLTPIASKTALLARILHLLQKCHYYYIIISSTFVSVICPKHKELRQKWGHKFESLWRSWMYWYQSTCILKEFSTQQEKAKSAVNQNYVIFIH